MALYRFLFAPALLAVAVLAGPSPSRAPSAASHPVAMPGSVEGAGSPRPVRAR